MDISPITTFTHFAINAIVFPRLSTRLSELLVITLIFRRICIGLPALSATRHSPILPAQSEPGEQEMPHEVVNNFIDLLEFQGLVFP